MSHFVRNNFVRKDMDPGASKDFLNAAIICATRRYQAPDVDKSFTIASLCGVGGFRIPTTG